MVGNRKFILIECEDYADTITAERVRRVINGVPDARDDALREGLDGSFTYCTLGKPIEIESMLTGEALPSYSALAANLLYTTSGVSIGANALETNDDGLFHSDDKNDYYLLYKPDLEYLRSGARQSSILSERKRIRDASRENGRKRSSTQQAITSGSVNSHRWASYFANSQMPCTKGSRHAPPCRNKRKIRP